MITATLSTLQSLPLSSPSHSSSSYSLRHSHGRPFESFENGFRRSSQTHRFDYVDYQETPYRVIERYREMVLIYNNGAFSNLAFAPVLKACSKASALNPGKQIHAQAIKSGLSSDVFVQTSLLAMYSSCGEMETVFNLFDKIPHRNVVTWTAMMDACLRSEQPSRAAVVFCEMQRAGVRPDNFSIVSLLSACARLGALNLGRWVHSFIEKEGLELTVFIGTALVDMYCKCGSIDDALMVFNSMKKKNVQSWNVMLHGLSVHGRGEEALQLFFEMEMDIGIRPNEVTFVGILCGCSHSGLVEEGRFYFDLMWSKYGIEPTVKHYGCMVDLLGRAGLLEEAFKMVMEMPIPPNPVIWGSLLSACRAQNNLGMAERVNQRIIEIHRDSVQGDTSHYVIMSNMYAEAGLNNKMAEARIKIGKKPKGRSWIEIGCDVHEFTVGDVSHSMWLKIKVMLNEIMKKREDHGEEDLQNPHSEKVAVAFGLLSTSSPMPIRIVKNLRICEDCHGVMKLISEVYEREIVLRDCTRFHRFMGGLCSCKDYW
ncbi:hypothetical protein HHK36_001028 [Tetracentron sinense]|uniref:DYW domain-containing protein n=1 Tax=Tetracentron sinense TaxID=13715 RepID=A0A834ZV77_TETSI|nr:hypothetical protein HHK36_001028 [Tetracentron sinense]